MRGREGGREREIGGCERERKGGGGKRVVGGVGEKFLKGHCYTLHTTHYTLHTLQSMLFFSFLFFPTIQVEQKHAVQSTLPGQSIMQ